MKLIIKKTYLKELKTKISSLNNHFSKPFGNCFYLEVQTKKTSLIVQNEFSICKFTFKENEIKGVKNGQLSIEMKTLSHILDNSLETDDLTIEQKDLVFVKNGKFSCSINKIDGFLRYVENAFVELKDAKKVEIEIKHLTEINKRFKEFTLPISEFYTDQNKQIKNCINIKKEKDSNFLLACSTDNYKFILAKLETKAEGSFEFNLFPYVLNLTSSLFGGETVHIFFNETTLMIKSEFVEFKTNNVKGVYPDLFKWGGQKPEISFLIDKKELISAINRNVLFSTQNKKFSTFTVDQNSLRIDHNLTEKGESSETITIIHSLKNTDLQFQLNGVLLKQLLKGLGDENIEFKLVSNIKPISISELSHPEYQQFILPTRV